MWFLTSTEREKERETKREKERERERERDSYLKTSSAMLTVYTTPVINRYVTGKL